VYVSTSLLSIDLLERFAVILVHLGLEVNEQSVSVFKVDVAQWAWEVVVLFVSTDVEAKNVNQLI